MVGVYSLQTHNLGQLLYSYIFTPNTVSVSLSPTGRHLVVGFASYGNRLSRYQLQERQVMAQIYKLVDNPYFQTEGQAGHLQLIKDIEINCERRTTSLNCIRWLPYPGQGLIYATNQGILNILECT